jgi:sugar (pentulose or hexulose) kinase
LVNPAVAYRAAMEGATYSLLAGVGRMSELGMPAPREVKVVGGGSKSPLWRQIIADAFDVKVRRLREAESAALGAATQAAAAAEGVDAKSYVRANLATSQEGGSEEEEEIHSPVPEAVEALRAGYELFIAEGRALFGAGGGE